MIYSLPGKMNEICFHGLRAVFIVEFHELDPIQDVIKQRKGETHNTELNAGFRGALTTAAFVKM